MNQGARVQQWMEDTNQLAQTMATEFDMESRYFLDIFFQGGAHMINHQEAVNPYNAFRGLKSMELREQGIVMSAPEIHTNFFAEYKNLTMDEKKDLCERWEKIRTTNFHLHCDTRRAKVQDVANIVRNMKMLSFCVVRNNAQFKMEPKRYFTSRELEQYMEIATRKKWVTGEVGMKLEAFAIAGCDPAKGRMDQGRDKIPAGEEPKCVHHPQCVDNTNTTTVEVSKVPEARLSWTWWEEDVEQRYSVMLDGWTAGKQPGDKPTDPRNLSTSQSVIRMLLEAIQTGTCTFRKLGPVEAAERKAKWEADVAAGRAIAKHRAPRCDAGRKRQWDEQDEEENDENKPLLTNDDNSEGPTTHAPAKKRACKAPHGATTTATATATAEKPRAKTAAPPNKTATGKKSATAKKNVCDDLKTQAALERLKAGSCSCIVSHVIITSDNKMDNDPEANEDGPTSSTSTPNTSALVVYVPPPSVA
ncbi:hypothetical protein B0H10DRAFT_1955755 [Mycena sp. CBHHK59/15]|nr:hypothetical protein B0H10DRAFT_1955755 [Mycena sp. CBHHK59/15]